MQSLLDAIETSLISKPFDWQIDDEMAVHKTGISIAANCEAVLSPKFDSLSVRQLCQLTAALDTAKAKQAVAKLATSVIEQPGSTTPAIAEIVCRVLNSATASDPDAMQSLMSTRVACNEALADHLTITVGGNEHVGFSVGPIGLLNGIVSELLQSDHEQGAIAACYENEKLAEFVWLPPVSAMAK